MLGAIDEARPRSSLKILNISNTRVNKLCDWRVKLAIDSKRKSPCLGRGFLKQDPALYLPVYLFNIISR